MHTAVPQCFCSAAEQYAVYQAAALLSRSKRTVQSRRLIYSSSPREHTASLRGFCMYMRLRERWCKYFPMEVIFSA